MMAVLQPYVAMRDLCRRYEVVGAFTAACWYSRKGGRRAHWARAHLLKMHVSVKDFYNAYVVDGVRLGVAVVALAVVLSWCVERYCHCRLEHQIEVRQGALVMSERF